MALEAGADSYFIKNEGRQALLEAIHKVLGGELYLSPRIQTLIRKAWAYLERRLIENIERIEALLLWK